MRSGHILGSWRRRSNLSMFLLTISVGTFWSVQSVLEFNAVKKNLRIMSDIERVFWTVLFRMASRVWVSVHRGGFPLPYSFLGGGEEAS